MTSGLRKAHKYIWLVLAITIPVMMVFAMRNVTIFSSEKNKASKFEIATKTFQSNENDLIKASLYSNRIEIILKKTLKNPTSIIYSIDKKGQKGPVIGQLTTSGIYTFEIAEVPHGITIFDALKGTEISKLTF